MHILECLTFHAMPPMWCPACKRFVDYDRFGRKGGGKADVCRECTRKRLDELRRRREEARRAAELEGETE